MIEEIIEEMKGGGGWGQGTKRKMNESEETEEIKTFLPLPLAGLDQL